MKFVFERMKVRSCLEIFTDFILDQIFVFTVLFKQNKNIFEEQFGNIYKYCKTNL